MNRPMRIERRTLTGALAGALLLTTAIASAAAQSPSAAPPLPPPRPALPGDAMHEPSEPPTGLQNEDAWPLDRPVEQTPAEDADSLPWPPADRAALHACALEWQRMKETGAAREMIWRDFRRDCLARSSPRK